MGKRMLETRTKRQLLPLRLHSRVRVVSVRIWASDSRSMRRSFLKCLNASGTVIGFNPLYTVPWRVKLDNGDVIALAAIDLEVLEP